MSKLLATHHALDHVKLVSKTKRKYVTTPRRVEVMAIASGYAMVRRPGCMPYIAQLCEIEFDAGPASVFRQEAIAKAEGGQDE